MLDQDFCFFLEWKIEQALANSIHEKLKHFSCDGIQLPTFEIEYSKKKVNDTRQILMTAYLGSTGQDKYELTLKFGQKALSRYARGLDILECLSSPEISSWLDIDIEGRRASIQFD